MTTRLFALLSLVLVVALSHAAPTGDKRPHVLEANVAKQQMTQKQCVAECVHAVLPRELHVLPYTANVAKQMAEKQCVAECVRTLKCEAQCVRAVKTRALTSHN